jgi:polyhydroxybutyrate depolymerase
MVRLLKSRANRRLIVAVLSFSSAWADSDPYPPLDHHSFGHKGATREYFVHAPQSAEGPLPVVVAIHGYTSTATGFAAFHDLREHADRNGYIVVFPQGAHFIDGTAEQPYRVTSWNMLGNAQADPVAGPQCTEHAQRYPCPPDCGACDRCTWASCGDDLGYFEALLDQVLARYPTDPDRYYVLGMSNGGMMALRLGCSLSHRFAAIAPIDAQMPAGFDCAPATPLPMIHLSGGKDDVVRPDGQPSGDGFIYVSAARTAATWARALSCQDGPREWATHASQEAGMVCNAYSRCGIAGQEVVACTDPEESHNWPGRRPGGAWPTCVTSQQKDSMPEQALCAPRAESGPHRGMDLVWEFFRRYERAPRKDDSPTIAALSNRFAPGSP